MAHMVKAVRKILGLESFGTLPMQPLKTSSDIEIEDDAPKRKPTLEEIDALEVPLISSLSIFVFCFFSSQIIISLFFRTLNDIN